MKSGITDAVAFSIKLRSTIEPDKATSGVYHVSPHGAQKMSAGRIEVSTRQVCEHRSSLYSFPV